jgi:hypothetical protein
VGIWTATPYEAVAGSRLYADDWNGTVRDGFEAFGAWTSYTPTWGTYGTAPSLGNGTLVGAWMQVQKLVLFRIRLTAGSTTTFGTNGWTLTLPTSPNTGVRWAFAGIAQDSSTGSIYAMTAGGTSSTIGVYNAAASPLTGVTNTAPFTWATGDTLDVQGTYEAA